MYTKFFGLESAPFSIAPDPRFLYMSERHREALAHLLYGLQSDGGFVLLTGEVGTGKTTVCRCLLEQIPENTNVALIFNPKLTVQELLATLCDELEIAYPGQTQSTKVFIDAITRYLLDAHRRGERTVLVIDEAQQLSHRVLEQLRLLTNLETNERKLLRIILLGQPELSEKLARPELRQLAQRITARYHLTPLDRGETCAYVRHRLSVVGGNPDVFTNASLKRVHALGQGIPRLINILCDRALLGAYVEERPRVTPRIVSRAANELNGVGEGRGRRRSIAAAAAALLLLFGLGAGAIQYLRIDERLRSSADEGVASSLDPVDSTDTAQARQLPEHGAELEAEPASYDDEADALALINPEETDDPRALNPDWELEWPAALPVEISRRAAFAALFERWHTPFDTENPLSVCEYAMSVGLRCLDKRGNLRSIMELDRPAVLELTGESGMRYHAALLAVRGDRADLVIGGRPVSAELSDVDARWLGDYTLFWQMPPGYTSAIREGDRGEPVKWLRERLAQLRMLPPDPEVRAPELFDPRLAAMLRDFQRANGLVADAVAGAHTWIKLNSIAGVAVPRIAEP